MPTKAQTILNAENAGASKEELASLDGYPVLENGEFDFEAIDASYEAGGDGTVASTKKVDATTTPEGEDREIGYVQDPKTHTWTYNGERVKTEVVPKEILEEQNQQNIDHDPVIQTLIGNIKLTDKQNDKIFDEVSVMTRYYNNNISMHGEFKSFAQVQRETEGMKSHAAVINWLGLSRRKVQSITDAFSDVAEFVGGTDFGTYDDHIAQARTNIQKRLKAEGVATFDSRGFMDYDIPTDEILKEAEK